MSQYVMLPKKPINTITMNKLISKNCPAKMRALDRIMIRSSLSLTVFTDTSIAEVVLEEAPIGNSHLTLLMWSKKPVNTITMNKLTSKNCPAKMRALDRIMIRFSLSLTVFTDTSIGEVVLEEAPIGNSHVTPCDVAEEIDNHNHHEEAEIKELSHKNESALPYNDPVLIEV
ncbi:unnamed protein product [Heligmosomoides polygyrus]|uniref:Major sperm protein n=1 Tax=Heligmosomoides polygyrus TaxID=6339 RepID=A0A183G9S9_HELPZ|nr:unnamed protein product [Heligmosomoides polygyrus]